jgi:hypothetical protein
MVEHRDEGVRPTVPDMTEMGKLPERLRQFTAAREWEQFHTPKKPAASVSASSWIQNVRGRRDAAVVGRSVTTSLCRSNVVTPLLPARATHPPTRPVAAWRVGARIGGLTDYEGAA